MTNYKRDYYKAYSALRRFSRRITYARFVDSYTIYFKCVEGINSHSLAAASITFILRGK